VDTNFKHMSYSYRVWVDGGSPLEQLPIINAFHVINMDCEII